MSRPVTYRLELLADRVRFPLENEDGYPEGTHQLLKRLSMSLQAITPAVQRMESRGLYSATEFRMGVRDGVYDAEDVLDKLQYRIRQQEEDDVVKQVPTSWQCFRLFSSHQDHQDHQALDELCEVVDRFVKLERKWMPFTIRIPEEEESYGGGHRMKEWFRENPPVVRNPGETIKLVGRAREKEAVLDFLMGRPGYGTKGTSSQGNRNNVEVLTILGEGGVGKTSLAQWAYHQPIVERHFHLRAWVHVTDQSVLERVVGEIVTAAASIELPQNSHDLSSMRLTLEKALQGRRFLIVLDDPWKVGVRDWEVLHKALKVGEEGSRLLITTRVVTAERTGTVSPICLTRLIREDRWSLLRLHAFGHECRDDSIPPEMERIAREIAKRSGGLPLVVKMLGGLLSSNFDIRYWQHILSSKLWDTVDANQSESAILICYEELPRHLKDCFAYCSLFPRNSGFERDILVRFWIAVGYVPSSKEKKLEDTGRQYFDELTQRSFFQKKQYQDGYGIHDILHDHAIWVSRNECYVFEDHPRIIMSKNTCHFRSHARNLHRMRECVYGGEHVRSLIIYGRHRIDGFADILTMFRGLRVLALYDLNIRLLPESIGELIHLRFLILHKLDVKELPKSVCRLYHLQGLDVTDCENLLTMPSGLHNLVNLRYLRQ